MSPESGATTSPLVADLAAFIAGEVANAPDPIEPGTDLVMSGLVDSLGVVMIVDWLEHRLGVTIDPGDVVIEHFESIDAMIGYLRGRGDCEID